MTDEDWDRGLDEMHSTYRAGCRGGFLVGIFVGYAAGISTLLFYAGAVLILWHGAAL